MENNSFTRQLKKWLVYTSEWEIKELFSNQKPTSKNVVRLKCPNKEN